MKVNMETKDVFKMEKELISTEAVVTALFWESLDSSKALITNRDEIVHLINRVEGNYDFKTGSSDEKINDKMNDVVKPVITKQISNLMNLYPSQMDVLFDAISERKGVEGVVSYFKDQGHEFFYIQSKAGIISSGDHDCLYIPRTYKLKDNVRDKFKGAHFVI